MSDLDKVDYMGRLLNQSMLFFLKYKAAQVHSVVVRRYRKESDYDYAHCLCAGVCSQLNAGKLLSEVNLEDLSWLESFDFISDEIHQEFFRDIDHVEVGYFLASLSASQAILNIIKIELCKRTKQQVQHTMNQQQVG